MKRKYLTELAINMKADYTVMLQQDMINMIHEEAPYHIYMITKHPRVVIDTKSIKFRNNFIEGIFRIQYKNSFTSKKFKFQNDGLLSKGRKIHKIISNYPYTMCTFFDSEGLEICSWKVAQLIIKIDSNFELKLKVIYIGKSFGENGERTAQKRLLEHATLQHIYFEIINKHPDEEIWILLWRFKPNIIMNIDGTVNDYGKSMREDSIHVNQVFKSSIIEKQRISYTEAALIRFFEPEYNIDFKNNFPNKNHSSYDQCYKLDLNSVTVEIETDNLNFLLWSDKVLPSDSHVIKFPLNSIEERKYMFER